MDDYIQALRAAARHANLVYNIDYEYLTPATASSIQWKVTVTTKTEAGGTIVNRVTELGHDRSLTTVKAIQRVVIGDRLVVVANPVNAPVPDPPYNSIEMDVSQNTAGQDIVSIHGSPQDMLDFLNNTYPDDVSHFKQVIRRFVVTHHT